jgi:hypothetical protein
MESSQSADRFRSFFDEAASARRRPAARETVDQRSLFARNPMLLFVLIAVLVAGAIFYLSAGG